AKTVAKTPKKSAPAPKPKKEVPVSEESKKDMVATTIIVESDDVTEHSASFIASEKEESDISPFKDDFDTSRKELEIVYAEDEEDGESVDDDLYGNDETDAFDALDDDLEGGSSEDDEDYETMTAFSEESFLDDSEYDYDEEE
ncbi:MAG: hypothetical protein KDK51_06030, partial [Deltaproteobacteria bacterium]|nr:hypothetical protein [Deltaproteobacteria bacterium]